MKPDVSRNEGTNSRRMAIALAIAAVYMVAEIVGGLLANSLALLADAGHMATDVASLGVSLWAIRLARKPPDDRRTYGYHRAEILAALANGATLVAIVFYIFLEAYQRLRDPPEVLGGTMLVVAVGGLLVNGVGVWLLHGGRGESLNVEGAWLHLVSDALGSIGVIVGALLIQGFGWRWADPVAGGLIGILILYSAWHLIQKSVGVLMDSTPAGIDVAAVRSRMESVTGVRSVHDLHIWTLTSGMPLLTAHVDLEDGAAGDRLLRDLRRICHKEFGLSHCTIQLEETPCETDRHR